jgi:hypothetical protein
MKWKISAEFPVRLIRPLRRNVEYELLFHRPWRLAASYITENFSLSSVSFIRRSSLRIDNTGRFASLRSSFRRSISARRRAVIAQTFRIGAADVGKIGSAVLAIATLGRS